MEATNVRLTERYYKPSGKFSVGRTILFTILISLVVAVLSVLYSCVMKWIPIVQLNFIITGIMVAIIFAAHYIVVRAGRIRNGAVNLIVGVILFLVFVYWHFAGYAAIYLYEAYDMSFFDNVLGYLFAPDILVKDVLELNAFGMWTMFGLTFKGILLTVLWVIEHIAVLAGALFGFITKNDEIYIESRKCWAEEKPLENVILPLPESVKESFEQRNYRAIENSALADEEFDHCVISYFTDEKEQSGEYYLKVVNVIVKEDEDDPSKTTKDEDTLIMGLKIEKDDLNRIRMMISSLEKVPDQQLESQMEAERLSEEAEAGTSDITAPTQGTVLEVKVVPGQMVEAGEVLVIFETMQMENDITAPVAGTVVTVPAIEGTSVEMGDVLVTLK